MGSGDRGVRGSRGRLGPPPREGSYLRGLHRNTPAHVSSPVRRHTSGLRNGQRGALSQKPEARFSGRSGRQPARPGGTPCPPEVRVHLAYGGELAQRTSKRPRINHVPLGNSTSRSRDSRNTHVSPTGQPAWGVPHSAAKSAHHSYAGTRITSTERQSGPDRSTRLFASRLHGTRP